MDYLVPLALSRAGVGSLEDFQQANGLPTTGKPDERTMEALMPYLLGFRRVTLSRGDTFWGLSQRYRTSAESIAAANPRLDPLRLPVGAAVTVPLPFDVVPTNIPMTSQLCGLCVQGLAARYPNVTRRVLTTTAYGRPLELLRFGRGQRKVIYTAAHHANEWLTATLLLAFTEALFKAAAQGGSLGSFPAERLLQAATVYMVPMVNPDGVDLVTGAIQPGQAQYEAARALGENYPSIPFPAGWKANLLGVDLNLNYPAQWEEARRIKFAQGFTQPGPRDFVGQAPLDQKEVRALYDLTRQVDPAMVLAYHSQGEVIYWQFGDYQVPGARELAQRFSQLSGYALEDTPYASSFAGYKDWFIQEFRRPGYTIEVGTGENPLPLSQFPQIYTDNVGILAQGMLGL